MPAALCPASLGVYGSVRHNASFSVFLVPHPAFCLQSGGIEGHRSSPTLPGLEHFHQVASQAVNLIGQPLGQSLQAPLEGAPRGEMSLLTQEFAHHPHLGGGFVEDREQLVHSMQPPYDHDHQSLQEKLLGVEDGPSTAARWWWRTRDALDETNQLDKDTVVSDHGEASGSSVHGHTPSSEASRFGASPDEVFYL